MSYRCGIGPGIPGHEPGIPGHEPGPPQITCDGCGVKRPVYNKGGQPYAWFMNGRPAPGWTLTGEGTPDRVARCPECKGTEAARIEAEMDAIEADPPSCLWDPVCGCEVCVRFTVLHMQLVAAVRAGGGK